MKKPVKLKVFVDKKKKKVMFAKAEKDFVDILFSFFTLPLGTIAKLSRKHADSKDIKVGSLTSLYESVVNLNEKHFFEGYYKDYVVNPRNPAASICQQLKVNLNEKYPSITPSVAGCQGEGDAVLVKLGNYIIADDLNVVPTNIVFLISLGVENINLLEERTMYFGLEEFLNLLNWSLLADNLLTNLVFGGCKSCSSCTTNSTLSSHSDLTSSNSDKNQTLMKLLVQKSNKKVLCAQAENPFVEMLFSFLTIPLGAVIRLTKDDGSCLSPLMGISNLYNTISCLGDRKYLKSEDVKTMLPYPKVSIDYLCVNDFLPIYEVYSNTRPGHFLKEQATFVVSNDLEIIASPSIDMFLKFNTLGVPVGDMEVLEMSFGEPEALLLPKASLTSTSALIDFLNAYKKKPKVESSA